MGALQPVCSCACRDATRPEPPHRRSSAGKSKQDLSRRTSSGNWIDDRVSQHTVRAAACSAVLLLGNVPDSKPTCGSLSASLACLSEALPVMLPLPTLQVTWREELAYKRSMGYL